MGLLNALFKISFISAIFNRDGAGRDLIQTGDVVFLYEGEQLLESVPVTINGWGRHAMVNAGDRVIRRDTIVLDNKGRWVHYFG